MIAAIATPIPMIPAVATTLISGASSGRRLPRLGIITSRRSVAASLRWVRSARLASRSALGGASHSPLGGASHSPLGGCSSPLPGVTDTKRA